MVQSWEKQRQTKQKYYNNHKKEISSYYKKKHRRILIILHQLKINGCAVCGYCACDRSLDFHHVNPKDKKFCLSSCGLKRTDESIIEELNKCILLCRNCHGEIEEKENRK